MTSARFKKLAPITLPSESALCPLTSAVMAVASSGSEVPSATKVSAMTLSGTPSASASTVPWSTSRSAPRAIAAAPATSPRMVFPNAAGGSWGMVESAAGAARIWRSESSR